MSSGFGVGIRNSALLISALAVCVLSLPMQARAQFVGGNVIQQIGGVHIDADGVVQSTTDQLSNRLRQDLLKNLQAAEGPMAEGTKMRVISLKRLQEAIQQSVDQAKNLSEDVLFLAGMQRVQYVFVDKSNNDILLAGPGEGWTVDGRGNVVGKTTGLPVLRLEDLLVALRTSDNARQGFGITVSINPTEEGNKRLAKFYRDLNASGRGFDPSMAGAIEEVLGPQDVSLTGVDTNSRFAQTLVAADYKMKRLGMGFEQSPVKNMPSFLDLCRKANTSLRTLSPRFWMECNYQPVKHSADKLAWEISGSVKAMTEDEFMNQEGERVGTGKANKLASRWAQSMTENYDELCKSEPVFAELRNLMDFAVVAALIQKNQLLDVAGMSMSLLADSKSLPTPELNVPTSVPSQCSFRRLVNSTLVTASGGVRLDSWKVIESLESDEDPAKARQLAMSTDTNQWWWNAE